MKNIIAISMILMLAACACSKKPEINPGTVGVSMPQSVLAEIGINSISSGSPVINTPAITFFGESDEEILKILLTGEIYWRGRLVIKDKELTAGLEDVIARRDCNEKKAGSHEGR